MFRVVQKFTAESFSHILVSQMTNKDDKLVISEVRACDVKPLPDVFLFDTTALIENGVDLRRVSFTIPSKTFNVDEVSKKLSAKFKTVNKGVENE